MPCVYVTLMIGLFNFINKKKEITEGKIYSPFGNFAERAKQMTYRIQIV